MIGFCERKKIERLMEILFGSQFSVDELKRLVQRVEDCSKMAAESEDDALSKRWLAKKNVTVRQRTWHLRSCV